MFLPCTIQWEDIATGMASYAFLDVRRWILALTRSISQNWRAVVALLCSVSPTLPGLISSMNNRIKVGNVMYLYNVAWLYGVRIDFLNGSPVIVYCTLTLSSFLALHSYFGLYPRCFPRRRLSWNGLLLGTKSFLRTSRSLAPIIESSHSKK